MSTVNQDSFNARPSTPKKGGLSIKLSSGKGHQG